ncbi:MAG: GDP-L-fucose synthase [Patescibacteria group bacterium]|jgi:GDP-L-fucose synthase
MDQQAKIYVAGHQGMVGSAIVRRLQKAGHNNLLLKSRQELDLLSQPAVADFFAEAKPEYVFLAAAKVGGILNNKNHKADFIYQNLEIQNNIIYNAWRQGVKKLLFLGSSCIYPRDCPQPMKEEYLLSGKLEETNDAYALAKIAGIKMCQSFNQQYKTNFISVMPTNLYGPHDYFDLVNAHVIPALIHKFHLAKINNQAKVELWGSGSSRREFLYVDDLADACLYLMNNYNESEIINIGTGEDLAVKELTEKIKKAVGFLGEIAWSAVGPDGTPQKLLDVSKLSALGWKYQINLDDGLALTYNWFTKNYDRIRK